MIKYSARYEHTRRRSGTRRYFNIMRSFLEIKRLLFVYFTRALASCYFAITSVTNCPYRTEYFKTVKGSGRTVHLEVISKESLYFGLMCRIYDYIYSVVRRVQCCRIDGYLSQSGVDSTRAVYLIVILINIYLHT